MKHRACSERSSNPKAFERDSQRIGFRRGFESLGKTGSRPIPFSSACSGVLYRIYPLELTCTFILKQLIISICYSLFKIDEDLYNLYKLS